MAIVAWILDIAGFVLFILTDSVPMWGAAIGLCVLSAGVAQAGLSMTKVDADGDGNVTGNELRQSLGMVRSCLSARNSAIASIVIIGIWGAATLFVGG